MEWTGLNELREKYLNFFESKGHLRIPSYSLVPQDDNTLLLINAGMAPMKKYFLGESTPPRTRVTNCQKCVRTPDIELVGKTARHGTFFEMLGNFSFGDYFKHEAIAWAWEFCTKTIALPIERLWVTIYQDDDEAYDIWTKEIGIDPSHVKRFGRADNFWEHGSLPCGPCSEIYFDRGPKYGCGKPDCTVGCECDRYVEFWNLVFQQFDSDGKGNYKRLPKPNIDTGLGLERLACILQGVDNLFEVDTVKGIMNEVSKISGVKYHEDEKKDVSLRIITDHIRSSTFLISDGVMPSNEGRGYVLRRLIRRASRQGKLIGLDKPFLYNIAETVIKLSESHYPELREKSEIIKMTILNEEESFDKTINQGLELLDSYIASTDNKILSGDHAFILNDTYGFPLDLTKEILSEKGMSLDEDRYNELMNEQKSRSRGARSSQIGSDTALSGLSGLTATDFSGYKNENDTGAVIALMVDGHNVKTINEGEDAIIVLNRTPFYAESGGQVGDTGFIRNKTFKALISNTTKDKNNVYLHHAHVLSGNISVGDTVTTEIDAFRRASIRRNHTAAHLLQASLRKILGSHVEQAGQLVDNDRLRFDFTHFSPVEKEELNKIEDMVNDSILSAIPVITEEMPIEEARKTGAMALFGEKYGAIVRVVSVDDFSKEFCGGTHVSNTSDLGLFKIISESSVAAGVRRIEAVTGSGTLNYMRHKDELLEQTSLALKVNNVLDLPMKAAQFMSEKKEEEHQLNILNDKLAATQINSILQSIKEVRGIKIITGIFNDSDSSSLKTIIDKLKDRLTNTAVVAVLSSIQNGKASLIAYSSPEAQNSGIKAGNLVKAVAQVAGGNGGGKPDLAMAGVKDISKVQYAVESTYQIVENMIK